MDVAAAGDGSSGADVVAANRPSSRSASQHVCLIQAVHSSSESELSHAKKLVEISVNVRRDFEIQIWIWGKNSVREND